MPRSEGIRTCRAGDLSTMAVGATDCRVGHTLICTLVGAIYISTCAKTPPRRRPDQGQGRYRWCKHSFDRELTSRL